MEKLIKILFATNIFLFIFSPVNVFAADPPLGFIRQNIWFSREPFYIDERVKIYTVIFNGSNDDFKGTVKFYVDDKSVGDSPFAVISGGSQVVWTDWIAKEGKHIIFAKIVNAKISSSDGKEESIELTEITTGEVSNEIVKDPMIVAKEKEAAATAAASKSANTFQNILLFSVSTGTASTTLSFASSSVSFLKNVLETFASNAENLDKKIENKIKDLNNQKEENKKSDSQNQSTDSETKDNTPFYIFLNGLYIFSLMILSFILSHSIIMYALAIYIFYKLLIKLFVKGK